MTERTNAGEFLVNRTAIPPSATRSITRYRACISLADRVITSRGRSIDSLASVAHTQRFCVACAHDTRTPIGVHRNVTFAVINAAAPRNATHERSRCIRSRVSRGINVPDAPSGARVQPTFVSAEVRGEADA